jgi:hypothetical protein
MNAAIDLTFTPAWQAQILVQRPLILPSRHFTYPREAEEVERGALELLVRPPDGQEFLATFALGFADAAAPSGVWSCPHSNELCALAGGYGYIVDAKQPEQFTQIAFRPVLQVRALPEQKLLLFAGSVALLAWGAHGLAWQTPRLSSEGLRIAGIDDGVLHGFGWDVKTDREIPFTVDLATGHASGGLISSPAPTR